MLTDKEIMNQIGTGDIVIDPFNVENLGTNSYDLTLSPYLKVYTFELKWYEKLLIYSGLNALIEFFYKPILNIYDVKRKHSTELITIPDEGYVLKKNQMYLASSNEYTETLKCVPKIEGKSSLARAGLFIHITAGFGDVGFMGYWTLELYPTQHIRVYKGMKICQISYIPVRTKPSVSYNNKKTAKYHNQQLAQESKEYENWSEG